jgi:biopolymer transport protein TolQ
VAPGIAEALTATAFGLGAAIPAVIGYNLFNGRLRFQMMVIDGFCSDFLNIVERYLVTEKSKAPEKV